MVYPLTSRHIPAALRHRALLAGFGWLTASVLVSGCRTALLLSTATPIQHTALGLLLPARVVGLGWRVGELASGRVVKETAATA
jgi:hypothetical protein